MICSHPIVFTTRVIKNNTQQYIEEHSSLDLYNSQVITPTETFHIDDVHDVSYRGLSDSYGFLYLHTIRGVRTFTVKEAPDEWIEVYHKFK